MSVMGERVGEPSKEPAGTSTGNTQSSHDEQTANRLLCLADWWQGSCIGRSGWSWSPMPNDGWKSVAEYAEKLRAYVSIAWQGGKIDARQTTATEHPALMLYDSILIEAHGQDAAKAVEDVAAIMTTTDFLWHEVVDIPKDSARVTVVNPGGAHGRPSMQIVDCACRFRAAISIGGGICLQLADAKSLMQVTLLSAIYGAELDIRAVGDDATPAVAALVKLIASGFGEGIV